ncbi:MAG: hypothetical protein RR984_00145 [Bacilli bacterium]
MKRMRYLLLFISAFFLFYINVYSMTNVHVNNKSLSPLFNKSIYVYNYFAGPYEREINVVCSKEDGETVTNEGKVIIEGDETRVVLTSSLDKKDYIINVYKEGSFLEEDSSTLKNLVIKNYDINFDSNVFEYVISVNDETSLDISYEVNSPNSRVVLEGNGNFNKESNEVSVLVVSNDGKTSNIYKIIVKKAATVFKEVTNNHINSYTVNRSLMSSIIILINIVVLGLLCYLFFFRRVKSNILLK